MKKNKAFTMVELVVVLAISVLLLGAIAGFSAMINKIIKTQKNSTVCVQEYQSGKTDIENFLSKYSSDYFQFEIVDDLVFEVYNSENSLVAKIEYKTEDNMIEFFELNNEQILTEIKNIKFTKVISVSFEFDEISYLLKCSIDFETYHDGIFLINFGGMKVGNIY